MLVEKGKTAWNEALTKIVRPVPVPVPGSRNGKTTTLIRVENVKSIRDYIAEDNEENAAKTIKEIYGKFENLQMFPGMGSDLSKRVSFWTDYKYAIWEDYVIIYKVDNEYVEIYRVINRYQDITRIFD